MNNNEITEKEILNRANEVFSALEGRTTPEEMQLVKSAFAYAC